MKDNILEIGDELFRYIGFGCKEAVIQGKVDRVTKTLAFIGTLKLKREMRMDHTNEPGANGYSYAIYRLVTDEIREEIKNASIRKELTKPLITLIDNGRGSIKCLSNDQLARINVILSEQTK